MKNTKYLIENESQLYRISKEYFENGKTQEEISKEENISRPHVSRLLARAKTVGIVKTVVINPNSNSTLQLCEDFRKYTPIQCIEIASIPEEVQMTSLETSRLIAMKASTCIGDYLQNSKCIGIGIGRTLYETSLRLNSAKTLPNATFVPAIGVEASNSITLQSHLFVNRFADCYKSNSYYTSVPIVIDGMERRSAMVQARIMDLYDYWDHLDTVIFGLGVPYKNSNNDFLLNEATDEYRETIAKSSNVGDILVSFFDQYGVEIPVKSKFSKMALSLNQLKKVKHTLCLAGGNSKVKAIATAIECGYINGLITDSNTARKVIHLFKK